jgi:hypothetical protein
MDSAEPVPGRMTQVGLWERVVSSPGPSIPAGVIAINLVLVGFVNTIVLHDFPNSADEYSYIISAQLFAEGKLYVPSPEPSHFFDFIHVINDGHFYGKYPPGWPLFLSVGVLVGAPWFVNMVLGALTLLVTYHVARRHFSTEVANIALFLTLGNPFLLFNSASYFSHTSCMLFLALFVGAGVSWIHNPMSKALPLLAGAYAGIAFLVRPFTTIVMAGTTLAYMFYRARSERRQKKLIICILLGVGPAIIFLAVYLLYSYLQTSNLLLSPFDKYDPTDSLSFPATFANFSRRFSHHILGRLYDLALWMPLAPLFLALYLTYRDTRSQHHGILLALLPIALLLAHFFHPGTGGNQYGPRYLYEASFGLFIVSACVICRFKRAGAFMLAGALMMNVSMFLSAARFHSEQIHERMKVYDLVQEKGIENAIVFLRTGSGTMPIGDLTRNGIHFDAPVLYVRDRGPENDDLMRRFAGRRAYIYEYDKDKRSGRICPYNRNR